MPNRRFSCSFLKGLICAVVPLLVITVCAAGDLSESKSFLNFIRSVDPKNTLDIRPKELWMSPCLPKWKGVKCNYKGTNIVEIRLESLNLSGTIDADSLCKLQHLQVLSLARNRIHGTIPSAISYCRRLKYLNLSSNVLSGRVPLGLTELRHLRKLDISNNHFTGNIPHIENDRQEFNYVSRSSLEPVVLQRTKVVMSISNKELDGGSPPNGASSGSQSAKTMYIILAAVVLVVGLLILACILRKKNETETRKAINQSPLSLPPDKIIEEVKQEEASSELVFFVEEHEKFQLEDLLEATADLRNQGIWSSLYKVILKNNTTYVVKRLKKLQVSFEEFGQTMRRIGNLKHPNILPLVGYNNSSNEARLLIYKYQPNGSLLNLLEGYIDGKRDFPWNLRLSIASGIARGLAYIYQRIDGQESVPHGNLKLSNILLNDHMEALISEYGFSSFLDPKKACLISNGYNAPEKIISEKGDVFSFGVILLELLTGKTVEKSGIDLPKWVRSMVREEWTGEVFDKEVRKSARAFAFPLLNISLKCVSYFPQDRPTMEEVQEKIEEVVNAHEDTIYEDHSISSMSSLASSQHDCCLLHTVIPESWDTPGSNYQGSH